MTLKEQFEAFKSDLKDFINTSVSFMDFKLADGTIVRCDTETLQKGSKLDVIDEKGNMLPMPDGEYEMDGQKFSVESGYVKDLTASQAPAATQEQAADPNAAPTSEAPDMAKMMDAIAALEARIAALEGAQAAEPAQDMNAEVAKVNEAVTGTITKLAEIEKESKETKEAFKKMFDLVEKIANETPEPTSRPRDTFSIEKRSVSGDEVEEFRKKYLTK